MKVLIIILSLVTISLKGYSIGRDTQLNWMTLKTEHLTIVYEEKNLKIAKKYALVGEMAYQKLFSLFKDGPSQLTIVLNDNTDITNGFATFLPYPFIMVYPTLPNSSDSISYYDKWEVEMLTHELTHIFTFYPANGFYTPLKYLFGHVIRPNALLPLWYQEGLAVNIESRLTQQGRLNSPEYSAYIRSLVKDNKLKEETIDKINESGIPTWPFGQRPYFYGSLIWNEIIDKNPNLIYELNERYSRRLPYLIQTPLEESIQTDFPRLYQKIQKDLQAKAQAQLDLIPKNLTETQISSSGYKHRSPSLSPNGEYLTYVSSTTGKTELRLIKTSDLHSKSKIPHQVLIKDSGLQKVSWSPDSKFIVYDKIKIYNRRYQFSDLYLFNLETKKEQRLTEGERALQAEFSPDGKSITYIQKGPGITTLKKIQLDSKKIDSLVTSPLHVRFSFPAYITENEILFLARNRKGQEEFRVYNTLEKKINQISLKQKHISNFKIINQKKIIFTASDSGTNNLYLLQSLNTALAVEMTNSPTSINDGFWDESQETLYYTQLSSDGYHLHQDKIEKPITLTTLKRLTTPKSKKLPLASLSKTTRQKIKKDLQNKPNDYSSLPYLIPKYWIPFIYPSESGTLIQGSTSVNDPLGFHSYGLDVSYDTSVKKGNFGFSYLNEVTPVGITLQYYLIHDLLSSTGEVIPNEGGALGVLSYIPGLSHRWNWGLNWSEVKSEDTNKEYKRSGPGLSISHTNLSEPNFLGGGHSWTLSHNQYLKKEDHYDYGKTHLSYLQNLNEFLPTDHNISFLLKSVWAPEIPLTAGSLKALGEKTINGNYYASSLSSTFLMRGYLSGGFISRKAVNLNLEYQFPLSKIYSGMTYTPLFFNKLTGVVFVDGIALDGGYYSVSAGGLKATELDQTFWSTGLEAHLSTTVGYHLPLSLIFGLYYGWDKDAYGGEITSFLGLGISGIEGIIGQQPIRAL